MYTSEHMCLCPVLWALDLLMHMSGTCWSSGLPSVSSTYCFKKGLPVVNPLLCLDPSCPLALTRHPPTSNSNSLKTQWIWLWGGWVSVALGAHWNLSFQRGVIWRVAVRWVVDPLGLFWTLVVKWFYWSYIHLLGDLWRRSGCGGHSRQETVVTT